MMIKTCRICGKEFEAKTSGVCCSDKCKEINFKRLQKSYRKTEGDSYDYTPRRKKVTKDNSSIVDIAVKARQLGMTYGQYVGFMYMSKMGVR